MKRRSFLASSMAAGAWMTLPVAQVSAQNSITSAAVVLTDISATSDIQSLRQFVAHFLDKGIWVTCVIRLPENDENDAKLSKVMDVLLELGSGLDFALEIPHLLELSPYFQARAVFEAKSRFRRILAANASLVSLRAILCDAKGKPTAPTGVRASAVRNVLVRPTADTPVLSENWENGVVRFYGGQLIEPNKPLPGLPVESKQHAALYYVSANALSGLLKGRLQTWSASFADVLLKFELQGKLALLTVSDLQFRDDFDQRRFVSVLLDMPGQIRPDQQAAIRDLRQVLSDVQIPFAIRPKGDVFWLDQGENSIVLHYAALPDTGAKPAPVPAKANPGFVIDLKEKPSVTPGLDGRAVLHLPIKRISAKMQAKNVEQLVTGSQDTVLLLNADVLTSKEIRRRVVASLHALRLDAVTQFVSLDTLAATLHTDEPVMVRHRLTRAAVAKSPRATLPKVSNAERERLLEDARHAWRYFEKYTERATGLCPATVNLRPGGQVHRAVTMWDVGSNLNAMVAAVEIGLIERKEAEKTIKKILPNLIGRATDGRTLPQGWIRTDRHRWGIRDFDGCDAGRLLASLDNVRRRLGMRVELEKLVARWDLDKIVIKNEIHSVISRKLMTTYGSHCAHYSALAFRRWGLSVASPYETLGGRPSADGEVAMLEAVSKIGPLGSEPLLLEAMEMGMSPESAYLAEVLFAAMEEEYDKTGRLICVSETPIDQAPWFIYQGLELGSGPRSWRLDTVGHEPQFLTAEAAEKFLTFSTKAAFLWAAYRPGPFSAKLLEFARQNARNAIGFSSGVNVRTQQAMADYSDLNSNAIILQAIADMLRT